MEGGSSSCVPGSAGGAGRVRSLRSIVSGGSSSVRSRESAQPRTTTATTPGPRRFPGTVRRERERDEGADTVVRDHPSFERGQEAGPAMSFDEAVAYALGP